MTCRVKHLLSADSQVRISSTVHAGTRGADAESKPGTYLSLCLASSSLLRRTAALAACFSVLSMMFSVTKSLPEDVDGLYIISMFVAVKTVIMKHVSSFRVRFVQS